MSPALPVYPCADTATSTMGAMLCLDGLASSAGHERRGKFQTLSLLCDCMVPTIIETIISFTYVYMLVGLSLPVLWPAYASCMNELSMKRVPVPVRPPQVLNRSSVCNHQAAAASMQGHACVLTVTTAECDLKVHCDRLSQCW